MNNPFSIARYWSVKVASAAIAVVASAAIATTGIMTAYAAPGDLDPTFGSGGIVIGTQSGEFYATTIQPDGKIVAAGFVQPSGSDRDFAVARYNSNGSLDTSFSGDGIAITDIGPNSDGAWAVTLQPDGKIIAAGYSGFLSPSSDFVVVRYNTDGTLDTSFGTSGIVTTDMGSSTMDLAYGVAVLPDGKIVAAGHNNGVSNADAAVVRYNANGTLDTTFGTGGIVRTDVGSGNNTLVDMVIQPDGKIVAAGYTNGSPTMDGQFVLYRYNTDGSVDTTFDGDGIAITDFGSFADSAYAMALQPDGKIIAGGISYTGVTYQSDFALARYNADGSPDTSFGTNGRVITSIQAEDQLSAIVLQNSGKIVAVGYSDNYPSSPTDRDFTLARYNADGSLDTSFSGDGIVVTSVSTSDDHVFAAASQADGKVVVAGNSAGDFALARYLFTDATPPAAPTNLTASVSNRTQIDLSWADNSSDETAFRIERSPNGTAGWVEIGTATANAVNYQDTGLACGSTYYYRVRAYRSGDGLYSDYSNVANATTGALQDGDLDPTFGSGGIVITNTGTAYDTISDIAIQPDNKIVVTGFNSGSVARYNPDGTLDTTFSEDGIVSTNTNPPSDTTDVDTLTLQPDGKIIVAGCITVGGVCDILVARYNAEGTFDTSFGTGGVVSTDLGLPSEGLNIALQPDGKIVVAGTRYNSGDDDAIMVRYNPNGSLDTSFGTNGIVITDVALTANAIFEVLVQPDGKIVAAGGTDGVYPLLPSAKSVLYRYNANGSLDTTFGTGGIVITDFSSGADNFSALALRPDGKIVAAGYAYSGAGGTTDYEVTLVRYNANGSLDTSFSADGKVITTLGTGDERAADILLQNNGKMFVIVSSGMPGSSATFGVLRYTTDGSLDTSFSGDGIVTTDIGPGDDFASEGAIQADGKIVVAGSSNNDFALARYVVTDSPRVPTLTSPANGSATTDNTPPFGWGDVTGAMQYEIQVDNHSNFSSPEIDETVTSATYTPTSPLDNSIYYWHVRAGNGSEWSDWSAAWTITVAVPPAAPTNLAAAVSDRTQIDLSWTDNASDETGFRIERSPNGTTGWVEISTAAANAVSYQDKGLACTATYYYRVRAARGISGSQPYSDYSNVASATAAACQNGDLDPTFGSNGVVITDSAQYEELHAVAIQPDGKIVAAGYVQAEGGKRDSAVVRYNPDGTLDTSFAGDGIAVTNIGPDSDEAFAVTLQPDGKIITAGYSNPSISTSNFAVVRYNTDGSLDASFGTGGIVTTVLGSSATATGVAVQPDGKIVAAGHSFSLATGRDAAVVRYNADGSLDTSFGIGGIVTTDSGSGVNNIADMLIQPDGKIVAAGQGGSSAGEFILYRYNANGSFDTTFDSDGVMITSVGPYSDGANAIALQPDGKIVAAGYSNHTGVTGGDSFALVRYNTNGSLDLSFDTDGMVITALGTYNDGRAYDVLLQPGGGITAVGYSIINGYPAATDFAFTLVHYTTNGSPDTSISGNGIVTTDIGSNDYAYAAALQPDGKIVAVGRHNWPSDFALARYLATDTVPAAPTNLTAAVSDRTQINLSWVDNSVDETEFRIERSADGTTGWVEIGTAAANATSYQDTGPGCGSTYYYRVRAYRSGDGLYSDYSNAANATTDACRDGDLDPTFGSGGIVIANAGASSNLTAVAIQPDGKIVAAGNVGNDFAVARYYPNGTLDNSFSDDGIATTSISSGGGAWAIALQSDGKILAGGTSNFHFALVRYNPDGSLDTSFGTNGIVITEQGRSIISLAVQPDNKIVAADLGGNGGLIARYNPDGSLDAAFGTGGIVTTSVGTGEELGDMLLQPDGKIVVAGTIWVGMNTPFIVYRYNTNGSLDTTFGSGGTVTTDLGSGVNAVKRVTLDPDGRIIAAGFRYTNGYADFALVRYHADGSLDTSFGIGGKVITDIQVSAQLSDAVLQNNGRIIATGTSIGATSCQDFVLTRYNPDGSLDTSFAGDGIVITNISAGCDDALAASYSNGKVIVAGSSTSNFALARYLASDAPLAPTLTSPANGSTITDNTPTFDWGDVTGTTQYQIQVDNNTDFTSPVIDETVTSSTYTPTMALANGAYYWHVRAGNGGEWSDWSAAWTVTVDTIPPAVPVLASPANGAATKENTPEFDWGDVADAVQYQIQIDDSSTFTSPLVVDTMVSSSTYTPATALADKAYYWHVRAQDAAGLWSAYSAAWRVTIDTTPPSAPTLNAPANKAHVAAKPTLSVLAVTGAKQYQFQVSPDPLFGTIPVDVPRTTTSYTLTSALAYGRYYWRVQALDAASNPSGWSMVRSFTVTIQTAPVDGANLTTATPTFTWTAVTNAKAYHLQVARDTSFSSLEVNREQPSGTSFVSPALDYGTHYWHMQVRINDVWGDWMPAWQFTVTPAIPPAPTLSSPANALVTKDDTPTLAWNAAAGDDNTYQLQVDNQSTFAGPERTYTSTIGELSYTVDPALPAGVYYWRVRTVNYLGVPSAWSAARSFTLDLTAPLPPVLSSPANGVSVAGTPTYSWAASATAVRYQYSYGRTNCSDGNAVYTSLELSVLNHKPPTQAPDTYVWCVQARDAAGNWSGWNSRTVTILLPTPAAPVLAEPANGLVTTNKAPIVLSWNSVPYGVTYDVQIAKDSTFTNLVETPSDLVDATYTVNPAALSGLYYWRVQAVNASGVHGAWSAARSFTVDTAAPLPPALSSPANGASVTGTPTYVWVASSTAVRYQYRYGIGDCSDGNAVYTSAELTTTSHKPTTQDPGTYAWCSRARDAAGNWSDWSDPRAVTIKPVVPVAPVLVSPANGWVTTNKAPIVLSWNSVPYGSTYTLQIDKLSTFGSPDRMTQDGIGVLSYTLDATALSGVYYWRVRAFNVDSVAGAWSAVRRFTVDTAAPLPPVLSKPADAAPVVGTPTYAWLAAITAVRYQFRYGNGDCSDDNDLYTSPELTVLNHKPPTQDPGTYAWCTRARDAAGNWSDWSAPRTVAIWPLAPAVPALLSPPSGSLSPDPAPALAWNAVPYGVAYQLQLDDNSTFSSLEWDDTAPTTSRIPPPLADGVYYWRVRAYNDPAGAPGAWSAVWRITISQPIPVAPALLTPGDVSTVATGAPHLQLGERGECRHLPAPGG